MSGDVDLTSAASDADLNASTVSGNIRAKGLKARGLTLGTVSGDVTLTDAACERLSVKSVSGSVEYSGTLAKSGRYDVNSHSGTVRLALAGRPDWLCASASVCTDRREISPPGWPRCHRADALHVLLTAELHRW